MAIRQIRYEDDEILRKKSRIIDIIDDRVKILAQDLIDTMRVEDGVGLAAPQVGVLKRIIVIDIGEGPITMINPKIISQDGQAIDEEGCLSVPGKSAKVMRPKKVEVEYIDLNGEEQTIEGEDLLARALCHEIDHLEGILYIDKIIEE